LLLDFCHRLLHSSRNTKRLPFQTSTSCILNEPLCEMNRMTIVPANEFFKPNAAAAFRDLA